MTGHTPDNVPVIDYRIFDAENATTISLTSSTWTNQVKAFGNKTEVIYILRHAGTKEVLKVGQSASLVSRFKKYKTASNGTEVPLELDLFKVSDLSKKSTIGDMTFYETTLRNKLIKENNKLTWDNTDSRLGKEGQGVPNNLDELDAIVNPPVVDLHNIFSPAKAKRVKLSELNWGKFSVDAPIVYILKDSDGRFLKVGFSDSPVARFKAYKEFVSPANKKYKGFELELEVEIFEIPHMPSNPDITKAKFYETALRKKLLDEGKNLPFDNTGNRLGRSGAGF